MKKDPTPTTKSVDRTKNSYNRSHLRRGLLLSLLSFLALSHLTQGQCPQNCDVNGADNTALGVYAFTFNTTGFFDTAVGAFALYKNTTGNRNTAIGLSAMQGAAADITGSDNTATGDEALLSETSGSFNVADGSRALFSNGTGSSNVANGFYAMYANTTGSFNVANGANALQYNTTGGGNVGSGGFALFSNTTGQNNVAEGFDALFSNTTGNKNVVIGFSAGGSITTGSSNVVLGDSAGSKLTTGSNNIDIGNDGIAGEAKTIRIGKNPTHTNTYIAGIYGVTASRGVAVYIDSTGHLGTTTSSARFKDNIKPMDKASEAIHALKPVTFRYRKELDPEGALQFGLVAEEVAKINPDLVARDDEGKPYTVRYDAVNAMLLNEFLKEHRKVQEQETIIGELNATTAKQTAMLDRQEKAIATLTSQVQEVSARIEVQQAAPRLVSE